MKNGRTLFGFRGRRWLWLIILIAVAGLTAILFLFNSGALSSQKNGRASSAATLEKNDISCLGRLLPGGRILQIASQPGAVIGELPVQRGQWVEQGEVLARLRDHAREVASLQRAEKEVAVTRRELDRVRAGEKANTIEAQQAAVARQESILRQKETHYERIKKLYEKRIIAASELEDAQTQRDAAFESLRGERQLLESLRDIRKEDVALAESRVEAALSIRKVARENVDLNIIRAPVSGRVLEIHAYPGEAVGASGILELGSGRDMMAEAEVYVSDIGRVRNGAQAFVSGDAFKGRLSGKVVEIASMVSRSAVMPTDPLAFSDLRIVKVRIRLDNPQAVAHLGNHQVSVTIKP